ncbi:MAG: cupin domain-containing protein [Coriobacteriales bacterium]|nr:cupin domain-containing protein [Coriobacteriales bacterium]
MYKNIDKQKKLNLAQEIEYQPAQVVSKTIVQNKEISMTLFSFDKGEELSTHAAGGDALVTVLDGTGQFVVDGQEFILNIGESLIMPKDIPHSVHANEKFKMLLCVSF